MKRWDHESVTTLFDPPSQCAEHCALLRLHSLVMDQDKYVYVTLHARIYAQIAIAISSTFTLIAFVALFSGDVAVYWSSFSNRFREELLLKYNHSDPLLLSDVHSFFVEENLGHEAMKNESNHLHIEYGTTWNSWCWNDPPLQEGLPSILRALEFHSVSQLLLRFTFLTSLSLRPILTYVRSLGVLTRLSRASRKGSQPSLLLLALLYASPPLQFLSTLAGGLALLWQQDLDFPGLMRVPNYAFALFYLLHMIVYSSIELLEPRRINTVRVVVRAALIIVFCWTITPTLDNQIEFLNRKTCDINLPLPEALCEYLLLLCITLFSLLEWTDVLHLTVTVVENPEELAMINRKLGMRIEEDEDDERF